MKKRYKVSEENGLNITIYTKKRYVFLMGILLFFVCWSLVGILAIKKYTGYQEKFFLMIWLLFWFIAECFLLIVLLWNLFGKENVTISENKLTVKKILFFEFYKRIFNLSEVRNIKVTGFFCVKGSLMYNMVYWGFVGEVIKFEYNEKKYGFGIQIEEEEAVKLVEMIKGYFM